MKNTSFIELNKCSLKKNLKFLRKKIGHRAVFTSVIKGNAYGHGIEPFVKIAEECGIDSFAVFEAAEAYRALQVKKKTSRLMIMGMIENQDLDWAIKNNISFYVFDMDRLEHAVKCARRIKNKAKIHIELETGLNRTGFREELLEQVIKFINKNRSYLEIEGICTHFAGAESVANYYRIMEQLDKFNKLKDYLKGNGIIPKFYHTACSAAVLTYPESIMDMVRVGIAQYGFWPSQETKIHNLLNKKSGLKHNPLHRVLTWKSTVMSIKRVKAGEFINYGNSFLTHKARVVAAIPVGYYRGYSRSLSNAGHVLIRGKKAPVIGLVNMSMFLVDVTPIKNIEKGDEVVLIGKHGKQSISVASFIELTNFINYELLTRLPSDIPRIIINS